MAAEIWDIAGRGLALIILLLFFLLLYTKMSRRTMGETWDDIQNWVGKK